jgi:hypothetical protein
VQIASASLICQQFRLAFPANAKDFQEMSLYRKTVAAHGPALEILYDARVNFFNRMTLCAYQVMMMSI